MRDELTMPPLAVEILPATTDWPHPEIEADFKARRYVWREVSEGFYWEMLGALPPVYVRGGWLLGEPWSHTPNGEPISTAFAEVRGRFFATMSTPSRFAARYAGLIAALPAYEAAHDA